jgi:hypothetical protein
MSVISFRMAPRGAGSSSSASRTSAGRRGRRGGSSCGGAPTRNGCAPSCSRSNARWPGECTSPSRSRVAGWPASCEGTTAITRCLTTSRRSAPSAKGSSGTGCGRFGAAARKAGCPGSGWGAWLSDGYLSRASCIPGQSSDSPPAPKAGAQCGSPARWDLRGGSPRTAWTHVPTRPKGCPYRNRVSRSVPSGLERRMTSCAGL